MHLAASLLCRVSLLRFLLGALCLTALPIVHAQVPSITALSGSRQLVASGGSLTLSVSASGTGLLTHQWKRNGVPIAGANAASFTLTSASGVRDNGYYQVVIGNASGTVTSSAIFVAVTYPSPQVLAWGSNDSGQTTVPAGLSGVIGIAAGTYHNLALKSDGGVIAWGYGSYGQTTIPSGLSGVVAIAAGYYHSLALRSDGTVVAWGNNDSGQTAVPPGLTGVVAIAAGNFHSLALKSDGTVVAWGNGNYGQNTPPADLSTAIAISETSNYSLALKADGTVVAWGSPHNSETTIPTGLNGVTAVAAASGYALALRSTGTVTGWGYYFNAPYVPPADLANVVAISASGDVALALKSTGRLVAWGDPSYNSVKAAPTNLAGIVAIAAGPSHGLLLRDTSGDLAPTIVTPPASMAANLGQGVTFSATVTSGTAPVTYQWAKNGTAIAGATNSTYTISEVLAASAGTYQITVSNSLGSTAAAAGLTLNASPLVGPTTGGRYPLTVGQNLTLTLSSEISSSATVQWRRNSRPISGATGRTLALTNVTLAQSGYYQAFYNTGSGPVASAAIFVPVVPANSQIVAWGESSYGTTAPPANPGPLVSVAARGYNSYAVKADGTLLRWGNYYSSYSPPAGLGNVVAVSIGSGANLALRADGTIVAWGESSAAMAAVPAGLTGVVAIAAGGSHALALKGDGTVVAWGNAQSGATAVPAGLANVVAIGAGSGYSVALREDGTMVAWGYNEDNRSTIPTALANVTGLTTSWSYNYAIKADGTVAGFGYNPSSSSQGGVAIPTGLTGVSVAVPGESHGLALKTDGTLVAWGGNTYGQANVPPGLQKVYGIGAGNYYSVALRDASGDTVPVIVTPPAALNAFTGQTVVFTVTATGGTAALSYQWRKDGVNLAGATGASLRLSQVTSANVGSYDVIVSDQLGLVTSASAALTVSPTLAVTTTVSGRHLVNAGQPLTLTALPAIPGPITYQWLRNGLPLTGANAATFSVTSATPAHAGTYRVVATNAVGAAYSAPIFVGVPAALELRAWGDNSSGQTTLPAGLTGVIGVAAGSSHSLALKSDGTVVAWGYNNYGQTNVPVGLTNVVAIAAGPSFSMALRGDGTVVTWGNVNYTPSGLTGVVAIAAGLGSGLAAAIKADGTVVTWDSSAVRAEFPAGLSEVIALSLGYYDRVALKADGTVVAATNSNNYNSTPLPAGLTGVVALSGGYYQTLALKSDGTVVAWGYNNYGDATVPAGLSGVTAIATGQYLSYAFKADGSVVSWGASSSLTSGVLGVSPFVALSLGYSHGLALRDPSGDVAPVITAQPVAQTATAGQSVTLSVTATGTPLPSFQWSRDGTPIYGATAATLTFTSVSTSNSGSYTVDVTNSLGTVTSSAVVLAVNPTLNQRGLLASSAHANAGPFALTGTFTVEGTVAKQMLIRGVGPALAPFGVGDVLADPQLAITTSAGVSVVTNDNWNTAANASQVTSVSAQVGAFAFAAGSKDAAVLRTFAPGTYHVRLTGAAGAGGIAFLEIYDADSTPRTVYLATSAYAGAGSSALIQGFNLSGAPAGRTYLIRALGPTLAAAGALADPRLAVFNADGAQLAANDDWAGDATLASLAASVGAMPLASASKDAALAFAPPAGGTYTVKVSGSGTTTGLVLLEIFEADAQRAATTPAAIVAQPQGAAVVAGQSVSFGVVTVGKPAPTFQWRKNSANLVGATDAIYTVASAQASDAADYSVVVTNAGGSAISATAPLTLVSQIATHAVVGHGYVAGSTVTLTNTLTYTGAATSLGWLLTLPTGWSYASGGGTEGEVKPAVGATGTVEWVWTTPPVNGLTFTCTLNVPAGETAAKALSALAIVRVGATPQTTAVTPGTLLVAPAPAIHSADTTRDQRISLTELTRVIELYNTRSGSSRTGAYAVAETTTEDGFAADVSRPAGASATLATYHTADTDRDGRFSVFELTRVIELYNVRYGTTRTGQYHPQGSTEDGFAPGP